jgi:hypothetical protein
VKKLTLALIFVFGISLIPAPKAEASLLEILSILFGETYGYEFPKFTPAPTYAVRNKYLPPEPIKFPWEEGF